jgi:hypothetical protein
VAALSIGQPFVRYREAGTVWAGVTATRQVTTTGTRVVDCCTDELPCAQHAAPLPVSLYGATTVVPCYNTMDFDGLSAVVATDFRCTRCLRRGALTSASSARRHARCRGATRDQVVGSSPGVHVAAQCNTSQHSATCRYTVQHIAVQHVRGNEVSDQVPARECLQVTGPVGAPVNAKRHEGYSGATIRQLTARRASPRWIALPPWPILLVVFSLQNLTQARLGQSHADFVLLLVGTSDLLSGDNMDHIIESLRNALRFVPLVLLHAASRCSMLHVAQCAVPGCNSLPRSRHPLQGVGARNLPRAAAHSHAALISAGPAEGAAHTGGGRL